MMEEKMNGVALDEPVTPRGEPKPKPLDPAVLSQIAAFRNQVQASIGEVVMALQALPRYRHQSIADLQHLVIEPLLHDRVAIARTNADGKVPETAGIAIWASVSAEVDQSIREQIAARTLPMRLRPQDWTSGEIHWLFDVIASSKKTATAVLTNFRQVVKDKEVRLHPLVKDLVDADVLEKLRVRSGDTGTEAPPH